MAQDCFCCLMWCPTTCLFVMTVPMWWLRRPRCDLAWTWASASTSSTPPPTSLSQPPSSAPATTPRSFLPPKPSARVGQHARLCLSGLQTHVITWCLLGPDTLVLLRLKATHYFTSCGLKGPPESNFVSSHCNERQTFQILYWVLINFFSFPANIKEETFPDVWYEFHLSFQVTLEQLIFR